MEMVPQVDAESPTFVDISNADANSSVEDLVKSHPVMLFSKSTCPFCFGLKSLLDSYGVHYTVVELDSTGRATALQQQLFEKGGERTVPQLFIDGTKVGGCTKCKELQISGEFQSKIAPYMTKDVKKEPHIKNFNYFYFPEVVNGLVVRATGTLSMIYAVLCVAFWDHRATKWAVLAIAIDYLLRIVFGSGSSPIGMVGALIVSPMKPIFTPGQPKQFAACCGLFMTGLSAALYLSGQKLGGVIMIALLIPPAGMEGILNFCLGCWMFGLAIQFKMIPPTIYEPYISYRAFRSWAYDFNNSDVKYDVVQNEHVLLPGQQEPSPVDLIRKDRLEPQYKNQDYSIRHVTVDFYAIPMTAAALAFCYKMVSDVDENPWARNWGTTKVYQVLAITASILFGIISIAYIIRAFMWPKKVYKEWRHPVYGNFFSAITITLTLLGTLLYADALTFGITVVWIGSVGQLLITVLRVSDLIFDRIGNDMISPALMMAPVGNFISAIAFCMYANDPAAIDLRGNLNYIPVARLWFAVAAVFGIILFTITFQRAMLDIHADPRGRPLHWIWMAAFAVSGPAYLAVSDSDGRDVLFQSLWLFSVFLVSINGMGVLKGFYSYVDDLSIWVMAFSFCALSLSTIQYNMFANDFFTRVLTIISLVMASASTAVCFTYTVMWAVNLNLFVSRNKWGPISFMKLTHEGNIICNTMSSLTIGAI
jgi:tellurite resistance protein TehA-like permease/glutaredoxin